MLARPTIKLLDKTFHVGTVAWSQDINSSLDKEGNIIGEWLPMG